MLLRLAASRASLALSLLSKRDLKFAWQGKAKQNSTTSHHQVMHLAGRSMQLVLHHQHMLFFHHRVVLFQSRHENVAQKATELFVIGMLFQELCQALFLKGRRSPNILDHCILARVCERVRASKCQSCLACDQAFPALRSRSASPAPVPAAVLTLSPSSSDILAPWL